MKMRTSIAIAVALLAAVPAVATARGSAEATPVPSAAPAIVVTPAPTPTPAPRLDLRSASNPVKRREVQDDRLRPKRLAQADMLCAEHGFGRAFGFQRDDPEGGWLVACYPKTGSPRTMNDLPILLVDKL